jgi:hypothetical protein
VAVCDGLVGDRASEAQALRREAFVIRNMAVLNDAKAASDPWSGAVLWDTDQRYSLRRPTQAATLALIVIDPSAGHAT